MTESNAAQPGLTDDEILTAIATSANFNETDTSKWRPEALALGRAIESALLSKLRAEGVPAGDERAAFEVWAREQPPYIVKDLGRDARNKENYGHATSQTAWIVWQARAALASAPVAGEAQKPVAYAVHGIDARGKIRVAAVKPWAGDESLCDSDGLGDMWSGNEPLVYGNAAPQASEAARILFPAHLRKMWSGGEVQAWLDEYRGLPSVQPSAKGSLERYRQWQVEQPQADKDGGDCAENKGANDAAPEE